MAVANGAVMIITGSAAGIGRELAEVAASNGARVVVNSRKHERMAAVVEHIKERGGEVLGVAADVRKEEEVDRLVEETLARFGRVDVLVNNAAGLFFSPAERITPNGWRSVVDVNLNAPFLCARAVMPHMREQGGGEILNISSIAAFRPHPYGAHYAAAKAGLNSLTETLAYEWARYGIRVNAVALGPVVTESSRFANEENRREAERHIPAGRIVDAFEVADTLWAILNTSSSYLTGDVIRLDGCFRGVLEPPTEVGA